MEKKVVSAIMLTLLLVISVLTLALNIQPVKADWTWTETIYIRADGSVDPDTAPISTVDNITYTLTDNIVDAGSPAYDIAVIIERDNITLDGAGCTLRGAGIMHAANYGISLEGRSNVTIKNINVRNFLVHSVWLSGSSNNTVSGNTIRADFGAAVWLSGSSNTVSGNTITANYGEGISLGGSSNIVSGNIIKNNGEGGVYLGGSSNIVSGNIITNNNGAGISLGGSSNIVSGNIITNNNCGVDLSGGSNNMFYHNNFVDNFIDIDYESVPSDYANVWDDGYPSGGNYWSDYNGTDMFSGPYQNETGSDGIGDTAYAIDTSNIDRYPLMNPWGASEVQVGVKARDWIKVEYTLSRWPAGQPYPEWLKVEFLSVEGTSANLLVTMHMSNGTELNATVPVDVVTGGQALGLSGFVIPANLTTGDFVYITGYGNIEIAGETTGTYAGASRTVVYASISQYWTQLTYYWDKQTGVMVEASTTSAGVTATAKATETNMWQAQPFGLPIDPTVFYTLIIVSIVVVAALAFFMIRRRKKPPKEIEPPKSQL